MKIFFIFHLFPHSFVVFSSCSVILYIQNIPTRICVQTNDPLSTTLCVFTFRTSSDFGISDPETPRHRFFQLEVVALSFFFLISKNKQIITGCKEVLNLPKKKQLGNLTSCIFEQKENKSRLENLKWAFYKLKDEYYNYTLLKLLNL